MAEKFEVNILGCGAATPTVQHNPSSQVIDIRENLFMVDCGEGTQLQFRNNRLRMGRLNRIFISHLHGDHCFGLIGLISTLALLGRTGELVIHAVADLEDILRPQINYFCKDNPYEIRIESFDSTQNAVIYEDKAITVQTIPLVHRVPCAGFLFKEKPKPMSLIADMIEFYNVPIKERVNIKEGADFVTPEGEVIPNARLAKPAAPPRAYAYCSDTAYSEKIIPMIEGADLLYHEATFAESDSPRAAQTGHSTAKQAAAIAKLANVKKLMLGHFSARYTDNNILLNEAKAIFGNTMLANEGWREKL